MSIERVDVLAGLDAIFENPSVKSSEVAYRKRDVYQVRAAVAKLIESTGELIDTVEPILADHGFVYVGKIQKAKRALAGVGGAS